LTGVQIQTEDAIQLTAFQVMWLELT